MTKSPHPTDPLRSKLSVVMKPRYPLQDWGFGGRETPAARQAMPEKLPGLPGIDRSKFS
jgi:hypothetical protein